MIWITAHISLKDRQQLAGHDSRYITSFCGYLLFYIIHQIIGNIVPYLMRSIMMGSPLFLCIY